MDAAALDLYPLIRPLLFGLDAERAHTLLFSLMRQRWLHRLLPTPHPTPDLHSTHFGVRFRNPLGLAAGMDKNGELLEVWARIGFGFAEVGTVTPRPQPGNPRPRMFRLPKDHALINRLGFNNEGAATLAKRLEAYLLHRPEGFVVGVNLGKNKDTPNEAAHKDYVAAFKQLSGLGDYFVVNVSSPNTPDLRALQDREGLTRILSELQTVNAGLGSPKPILVKIAPDLSDAALEEIVDVVRDTEVSGIVATNTTIARNGLRTPPQQVGAYGAGGLSGAPLHSRSVAVVKYLTDHSDRTVVGVGGIVDGATAHATLMAGARLLQVYSGLVYRGPALIAEVLDTIAEDFKANVCSLG